MCLAGDPSSARGLYTYAPVITIAPDGDMIMGKASNPDLPRAFKNPYTLQRPKTSQVPMHITNASIDAEVNRLFPLFASQTKRAVCVVNPGDMIYFPGCYFHEVVSKGRHLGINFWIKRDRRGQFRSRDKGLGADTQLPPAGIHSPLSGLHVSSITMK